MVYLCTRLWWASVSVSFLLVALIACGSPKRLFRSKKDPQVTALQREMRQLTMSNTMTQNTIEDVCERLYTLETRVTGMESTLEDVANRPEPSTMASAKGPSPSYKRLANRPKPPVTELGSKTSPPKVLPDSTTTEPKTGSAATKKQTKSAPRKPTDKLELKKTTVSAKRSPERAYEKAYAAYSEYRYDEALALFKSFLQHYPQHDLADNAQYWIGEIYYDIENYPKAILTFKEVATRYENENKAPDALLKIAYAYIALDDPSNARIFLRRVIKNYPFSDAEAKAQAKLQELENL